MVPRSAGWENFNLCLGLMQAAVHRIEEMHMKLYDFCAQP
jgi:hypothetical protein